MKEIKIQNIPVYLIPEARFKTAEIGIKFFIHLKEQYIPEYYILTNLLSKTNSLYKKEEELSYELENLYDARIASSFSSSGNVFMVKCSTYFIAPKFVDKTGDYLDKLVNIFFTSLFEPDFTKEKFELEKALYLHEFINIYNNKERYAGTKFLKYLLGHETVTCGRFDMVRKLKKVTFESLQEAYHELLSSPCSIYAIGDLDEAKLIEALNKGQLNKLRPYYYNNSYEFRNPYIKHPRKVKVHVDETKESQSLVFIGYRQTKKIIEEDVTTYNFFNVLLGDFSSSLLFKIVREKFGLCYNVSSAISTRAGYLNVFIGLSKNNIEKAVKLIEDIVENVKNGNIDDKLIALTKRYLISIIKDGVNSQGFGLNEYLDKMYGVETKTLEERIEEINSITKEMIAECAKTYKLDTIYVLRGSL